MTFAWPWALLGLALLPVLVWGYLRELPRGGGSAALHPDLALLARAGGEPRRWLRHLPAGLYLLAVALALVALARPHAPLPLPDNRTAVMLVIDVSRSMEAPDIEPSRFVAAQRAARQFVRSLPGDARVGVVSFAGYAVLHAPPTARHNLVFAAIDDLVMANSTAIGEGLGAALAALPERGAAAGSSTRPAAAVVLLSDGRNNSGPDPLEAAARARKRGVRVYTVGLGTENGNLRSNRWGGFRGGFDAETLKRIAATTGGRYFEARSSDQLSGIYRDLGRSLGWTVRPREVSGVVGALAALALLASLAVSEGVTRRIL